MMKMMGGEHVVYRRLGILRENAISVRHYGPCKTSGSLDFINENEDSPATVAICTAPKISCTYSTPVTSTPALNRASTSHEQLQSDDNFMSNIIIEE
jgi:hypothetical protein